MRYKVFRRVVVKVGSNILTDDVGKLDLNNLRRLVDQIAEVIHRGIEVIIVTSGAIVCGSEKMGIRAKTIRDKQAAAAIGQSLLMNEYKHFFEPRGITVAQLLLTADSMRNELHSANARNTLNTLLEHKVVPIINENDSVVVDEIRFGDNDTLAAYVTELIGANALLILTDIDGLYSKDPRQHNDCQLIEEVCEISDEILEVCGRSGTDKGTGGMYSKVRAAQRAIDSGAEVIIANGRRSGVITDIFKGVKIGTRFLRQKA